VFNAEFSTHTSLFISRQIRAATSCWCPQFV